MHGREANVRARWFVFGVIVGIAWTVLLTISIQRWGNGAGVGAMVAILPIIALERWLVVRSKQTPPYRTPSVSDQIELEQGSPAVRGH